jgi:hypothetical protein
LGRTTVPPDVFSRDLHQPSVKSDDTPEPEKVSALPEAPSALEGEALRVEEERNGVPPNRNWQTPYLQYLHRAKARRLARRAKSFVLLGNEKELYHRSPSGILQRCISITEGQKLLQEVHSGACGHHAAPRALVGNAFRQGLYWPTAVTDATRIVRTCQGCQFYARQTHLPAQTLQTIPISWSFAVWGLDLVGPLQKAPGGYTHLLVAIDKLSKWIEVRPLNSIRFGRRWMKELPSVVWSLRTTPSRATGFSLFFLVYGAEAILPTDLEYGSLRTRAYDDRSNQTN